ncbi:hypothetical protein RRF57_011937 [Xylaria bambusicola]|uniref:Uncharacterized protein n=1 Tax=Xylaria bambusicola TaxID=326684 RepID=A0AAN7UNP5_9PEZI
MQDLIMSEKYIPPFRLRALRDALAAEDTTKESQQGTFHSSRGEDNEPSNGGRGQRDQRRPERESRKQKPHVDKQKPQVDPALEYYSEDGIQKYFLGKEPQRSLFRDSKDRPGQLSHMLLFFPGMELWTDYRIVCTMFHLNLLPEYAAKKAEKGEWVTEHKRQPDDGAPVKSLQDRLIEDKKDAAIRATPISTPPNIKTTSHMKYMDAGTEIIHITSAPYQPYTDTQFYYEPLSPNSQSEFPSMAPIDYEPPNALPIAVFVAQQLPGATSRGKRALYLFKGWFKISRVNILAPHSAELKWERNNHQGHTFKISKWKKYLANEWAVVRFKDLGEEGAPPRPQIERLSESEVAKRIRSNDRTKDKLEAETVEERPSAGTENGPSHDPADF